MLERTAQEGEKPSVQHAALAWARCGKLVGTCVTGTGVCCARWGGFPKTEDNRSDPGGEDPNGLAFVMGSSVMTLESWTFPTSFLHIQGFRYFLFIQEMKRMNCEMGKLSVLGLLPSTFPATWEEFVSLVSRGLVLAGCGPPQRGLHSWPDTSCLFRYQVTVSSLSIIPQRS